jgi:hypothetical protein
MQQWQVFVKSRLAEAKMLTVSPTIANAEPRLPRPPRIAQPSQSRSLIASVHLLLYAVRHAHDQPHTFACGTGQVRLCLDFCAPHVYPEACQIMPQVDRDAVIVFSGN